MSMDDHLKPFGCPEPGCGQSFASEDRLNAHCDSNHYVQHLLAVLPNVVDQTPTPTKFLISCEEVGLFQEINPFDKDFKKAVEQQQSEVMLTTTIPYSVLEESVETDDIAVDVSSPTTYIQSHEDSVAVSTVVSSGDDTVVGSHSSAVFDNIQLSDTDAVNADLVQTSPTSLAVDLTTSSELPTLDAAASSLVNFSSNNGNVGNLAVQVMLKLPTGETVTVPYSMPAIVIIPTLTSSVADDVLPQSVTTISSKPMQLMSDGASVGMVSYADQVLNQNLLSLNSQALLGSPSAVSGGTITGLNGQPGAVLDVQESGLTALGIAASTREKLKAAVQRTPNTRTRPTATSSNDSQASAKNPCLSLPPNTVSVVGSSSQRLSNVQRQAADTSTHLQQPSNSNSSNNEVYHRRKQFLESNRAAALRCRRKKKNLVASLENKVAELQRVNDALESEARSLKHQIYEVKLLLLEHKDCPAMTNDVNVIGEIYELT